MISPVKLTINNGTVDIQQGGSLKTVDSSTPEATGPSSLGSNGTLRLSGNGSLSTVDVNNAGVIELNSVDSTFNEPPSVDFDESAWIGNGGTAIVDSSVPDIVKLSIPPLQAC